MLAQFGTCRSRAVAAYQRFVHDGIGGDSIWQHLKRQIDLGDDTFIVRAQKRASLRPDDRTTFHARSVGPRRRH